MKTEQMDEMTYWWGYEEKLLHATLELETVKAEARDQMLKNEEYVHHLIQLLKFVIQERDEARTQLQKLLNKSQTFHNMPSISLFEADNPAIKQGKANSGITESDSTFNYYSHNSPVEPFFDTVTSPEFSNNNLVSNNPFVQDSSHSYDVVGPEFDEGSVIIHNLAKGRVLPQKGMLLQAVLGAGPLLKTLLLAAPLPRWRNPPQLQPFQIPFVSTLAKQAPNVCLLASTKHQILFWRQEVV